MYVIHYMEKGQPLDALKGLREQGTQSLIFDPAAWSASGKNCCFYFWGQERLLKELTGSSLNSVKLLNI